MEFTEVIKSRYFRKINSARQAAPKKLSGSRCQIPAGKAGMKRSVFLLLCLLLILTGCSKQGHVMDGEDMVRSFQQISQDRAKEMMALDDGHIIVDVRRQDEYDAGHIPGAVLIPNESIGTERPEELPDPDQIILVYCRSGNRSKQAAEKLFRMGYTNIYDFGGINTWTGEIVKGSE